MLLAGCTTRLDAGFFRITLPPGFVKNEISDIPAKVVCSPKSDKLTTISQMTALEAYLSIDWVKMDIKNGQATDALGIGTVPEDSVKLDKGTKDFGKVLCWEETVVVMDSSKKSELRWLYHVIAPLDGGKVDFLFSLMPNKQRLEEIKASMETLEFTDLEYFKK